ncbi:MAG: universal stress protein [Gemmatimonadaceae bacterium]
MYKTIMVPTDCSGFDREAIRVALRLADRSSAVLHLVRVRTNNEFIGTGLTPDGIEIALLGDRDSTLSELNAVATECRNSGNSDVVSSLEEGPVPDALAGYASRNDISLIVISSHSRGGFSRFSLGSVTDSLIRHTTIPVLVVKSPASYLNPQVRDAFRRIVVPLDGSPLAERILPAVVGLAGLEDAEITLLNVQSLTNAAVRSARQAVAWTDASFAATQGYLRLIAERLRGSGLTATCEIVVGDNVAEEIAAYAARERADLIAIATHGRGGLSRMLRGSIADLVTRSAKTSIFALHPSATPVTETHYERLSAAPRALAPV